MQQWLPRMVKIVLALGLAACLPLSVSAKDLQEVKAEGRAAISSGNLEGAKKAALLDAKLNAVDQVGSEIMTRTVVEDFDIVKDQIISKATGFIHSFTILQQGKKGSEWVVEIQAKVSATQMADEAKFIYQDLDKPRIMVIVPQISANTQQQSRSLETAILSYFSDKSFEVVDANTVQANIKKDEMRLLAGGDEKAAAKIALRSGAEVVILGDASVGKPTSVMGELYSASGNLALRAIQASNAKIIAAATISEKVIQATPDLAVNAFLKKAADKGQSQLFSKIIKTWSQAALNGQRLELKLSNVKSYGYLKKIKILLQSIDGVTETQQRTFSKPVALFDVTFRGSSDRLAELLDGKTKAGISIEITDVSAGMVQGVVK